MLLSLIVIVKLTIRNYFQVLGRPKRNDLATASSSLDIAQSLIDRSS